MSRYLEISAENKKAYFERKAKIKSKAKISEALKIQKTKEYISLENDIHNAMLKMKDFLSDRPEILAKQYVTLESVNAFLKGD